MVSNLERQLIVTVLTVVVLAGCSPDDSVTPNVAGRWYTAEQVDQGQVLFATYCASCHGERAQGLAEDWKKTDAHGNYPPPPLNGSAHAWHHPLVVLESTIAAGGAPVGGVMPGFAGTLSAEEARATIAYFQSHWSDDIYVRWRDIDAR
jgi:mono/diheme cytochrome c family protein